MKKLDILFLMPQLHRGGAEGVIVNIINNLDRERFRVNLLLFQKRGDLIDSLRDDVNIYTLNIDMVSKGIFKALYKIYKIYPDIVFSGISNLNIYLSAFIPILKILRPKIKYIARQASILSLNNRQERAPKVYELLHKTIYKNYDLVICQSRYMRDNLVYDYKFPKEKTTVINNPIDIDLIKQKAKEKVNFEFDKDKINLISVGNLRYEKRFDLLLKTFSLLDERYILNIIGDGAKSKELQNLAKELNIDSRVNFLGYKSNPYPYLKRSDIFVLTSEYEGFPNAVLEANLLGLYVIGFRSVGGVNEIIENQLNGYLVNFGDINQLAEAIESVNVSNLNREDISKSVYKFSAKKIIKDYERALEGLKDEK